MSETPAPFASYKRPEPRTSACPKCGVAGEALPCFNPRHAGLNCRWFLTCQHEVAEGGKK